MSIQQDLQQFNEQMKGWETRIRQASEAQQFTGDDRGSSRIEQETSSAEASYRQKQNEIMVYCRIAQDNSYLQPDPTHAKPLEPDIAKLGIMTMRINTNRRSDPMADQVVNLCSQYLAWVYDKLAQVDQEKHRKLETLAQEKRERQRMRQSQVDALQSQAEEYLRTEANQSLARRLERICNVVDVSEQTLGFDSNMKQGRAILGFEAIGLAGSGDMVLLGSNIFGNGYKRLFQNNYDEQRCCTWSPRAWGLSKLPRVRIEYTDQGWGQVKRWLWSVLLRVISAAEEELPRVTLLDELYYSMEALGPLGVLAQGKDSIVEPVPIDDRTLKAAIASLVAYYSQQEARLGQTFLGLSDAKEKEGQKLPTRILIWNHVSQSYGRGIGSELSYLLNNAHRLGIWVIELCQRTGEIRGEEKAEFGWPAPDKIWLKDMGGGQFVLQMETGNKLFRLAQCRIDRLPEDWVKKIQATTENPPVSTKYLDNFQRKTAVRSQGRRRPLTIPFALDPEGRVISCTLENENFAAYMMGASRSGKTYLLQMMISHVLMNYHPDEVELWLLDYKTTEFSIYATGNVPHIKYLLAEDSQDLSFDILDKLTEELNRRKRIFARRGWHKQTDVPVDIYMPEILVIIDEFARFSQYIQETIIRGTDKNYALKLENLLAQGAAMGFRFIFASQTYSGGVGGLTATARKQIQTRIALKNTYSEIQETLALTGHLVTDQIKDWMNTLPVYECLYKWQEEGGQIHVEHLRNMWISEEENHQIIQAVGESLEGDYRDKKSVLLSGSIPRSFQELLPAYEAFEAEDEEGELEDGRPIYAGVPRSFYTARPFVLRDRTLEHMLLVGGSRDRQVSVMLSILASYERERGCVELWTDKSHAIWKKYRRTLFRERVSTTDPTEMGEKLAELKESLQHRRRIPRLIVVLGYPRIKEDWEQGGEDWMIPKSTKPRRNTSGSGAPDMASLLSGGSKESSGTGPDERAIQKYNASVASSAGTAAKQEEKTDPVSDLAFCLQYGPAQGLHFLFCYDQPDDIPNRKETLSLFRHRLVFSVGLEDSRALIGSKLANNLPEGCFVYSGNATEFTMKPHLHRGVPRDGWQVDEKGQVVFAEEEDDL